MILKGSAWSWVKRSIATNNKLLNQYPPLPPVLHGWKQEKHCTNVSHVYFRMACKALYTNLLTIRLTDNELRKQIFNLNSSHHEATARTIHHRQYWFFGESIPIVGQKNPISPHRDSGRFDRKTHFWYWYISSCNNDNIKLIMII